MATASPRDTATLGRWRVGWGACALVFVVVIALCASLTMSTVLATRHRPGPSTIRGTIVAVSHNGFTLHSPSKGNLDVATTSLTQFLEQTHRISAQAIRVGSHVSVRGYLSGHVLRAIRVDVLVLKHTVKPKLYTYRGTVVAVGATTLDITVGGHRMRVRTTSHTVVEQRRRPVALRKAVVGERVDVRGSRSGADILATRITLLVMHVSHPPTHDMHGTVVRLVTGGFVVQLTTGQSIQVTYRGHVHVGEMVSVRVYVVHGRFTATSVREIKQLALKTTLVRGSVVGAGQDTLRVRVGKSVLRVKVDGRTRISIGSRPGHVHDVRSGQTVSVRYEQEGAVLLATSIHVYSARTSTHPRTTELRGTVVSLHGSTLSVAVGSSRRTFVLTSGTRIDRGGRRAGIRELSARQSVGVRYYAQGHELIATSVHIYATAVSPAHAPSQRVRGVVVRVQGSALVVRVGARTWSMTLTTGTHVTQSTHAASTKSLRVGEQVLVRFHARGPQRVVTSVHIYATSHTVNGGRTQLVRGTVRSIRSGTLVIVVGGRSLQLSVTSSTHIHLGEAVAKASALAAGETVSVRYRSAGGHLIATSVHIYAAGHSTTSTRTVGVRGVVRSAGHGVLVLSVSGQTLRIALTTATHIRVGDRSVGAWALTAGQNVSVHYRSEGGRRVATSVHVYVSTAARRSMTGLLEAVQGNVLIVLDRGARRRAVLSPRSAIRQNAKIVGRAALHPGERVHLEGSVNGSGVMSVDTLDILSVSAGARPTLAAPTSIRGVVVSVSSGSIVVQSSRGAKEPARVAATTRVTVRGHVVPSAWLFPGPVAHISLSRTGNGSPVATAIDFHPKEHVITGDVLSRASGTITVVDRAGAQTGVLLAAAGITDGGQVVHTIPVGSHVKVDGFELPSGQEAGLDVVVTHPLVHVSGIVAVVRPHGVTIQTAAGTTVVVHFPASVTAVAIETEQRFPAASIPIGTRLRVIGVRRGTEIVAQSASLTLKSQIVRGTVSALGGDGFTLTVGSTTVTIHVASTTHITVGRSEAALGDILPNDDVSVRGYPDAVGGILAHSVDIHRRAVSRTGDIQNLQGQTFDLARHDGSVDHVVLNSITVITSSGAPGRSATLANGQHVTVYGHLRPDGVIEATRITIKS